MYTNLNVCSMYDAVVPIRKWGKLTTPTQQSLFFFRYFIKRKNRLDKGYKFYTFGLNHVRLFVHPFIRLANYVVSVLHILPFARRKITLHNCKRV